MSGLFKDSLNLPKPFRCIKAWNRDPTCKQEVEQVWNFTVIGNWALKLLKKLKVTASKLKKWNKNGLLYGSLFFSLIWLWKETNTCISLKSIGLVG